jgi:hypothetical protein
MGMGSEFDALAALALEKEYPVLIWQKAGWAQSRSVALGADKSMPMPGVEPWVFSRTARSLVNTTTGSK